MNHEDVQAWLDSYVAAWRSNDPRAIADLFTPDALYSYRPWLGDKHTMHGRDAIVAGWTESPDDPGSWDAHYEPYAVDGDRAVAIGWSRYAPKGDEPEKLYHNAYVLRFGGDGQCAEFRDFYFLQD
jgi:uncharacterized protein (TIGR02246 family)